LVRMRDLHVCTKTSWHVPITPECPGFETQGRTRGPEVISSSWVRSRAAFWRSGG